PQNQNPEPEEIVAEAAIEEPEEGDAPAASGAPKIASASTASTASAAPAAPAKKAGAPAKLGFMGRIMAMVKPDAAAASSPPAAAPAGPAVAAITPPLTVQPTPSVQPSLSERVAANQQEFTRLSQVYEGLKKERGYLRKWDQDAIKTYNEQAAKY